MITYYLFLSLFFLTIHASESSEPHYGFEGHPNEIPTNMLGKVIFAHQLALLAAQEDLKALDHQKRKTKKNIDHLQQDLLRLQNSYAERSLEISVNNEPGSQDDAKASVKNPAISRKYTESPTIAGENNRPTQNRTGPANKITSNFCLIS